MPQLHHNPFSARPAPAIIMDAWIEAEKNSILLDDDEKAALLADHWELHPAKVGNLIANAASGNLFLRRAARADLWDLIERLADTEACERYHAKVLA